MCGQKHDFCILFFFPLYYLFFHMCFLFLAYFLHIFTYVFLIFSRAFPHFRFSRSFSPMSEFISVGFFFFELNILNPNFCVIPNTCLGMANPRLVWGSAPTSANWLRLPMYTSMVRMRTPGRCVLDWTENSLPTTRVNCVSCKI